MDNQDSYNAALQAAARPRAETALKLKEEGRTWEEIGELLGVSRQRAQALGAQAKRYRKSRA
jgi:DNA-directed RNA polymerase sigma subunit (sigma70/sigma32)